MSLESDIIACDRETGLRGSFYEFIKLAWPHAFPGFTYQDNWNIPLMAEHYEASFRGEIETLVVNVPPNSSKSTVTCVLFPVWTWVRDPHLSFIMSAYGTHLVNRDSYASQDLIRSPWFQARWGDRFTIPNVTAVERVLNDKGGFRVGTTPGAGNATGLHANFQIYDDPNKPEECTSVGLASVRDWYARTMSTRWRAPPDVLATICIMQRLHCDDLAQMFLDRGAVHIMLPAQFDPARRMRTAYGYDPRTEKGQLLDPVRLPQKKIDALKLTLGTIHAAAQLDQNPVPEGGAVFKKEHLKYWLEKPARFDQIVLSWDCSFKDEEGTDYVCGQVWGKLGVDFYLLDQAWDRMSFSETLLRLCQQAKKWPEATAKLVEDKANGPAVLSVLAAKLSGLVAITPEGGKFSRAAATTGFFEAGNVYFPDPKLPGYAWVEDFVTNELLRFPRASNDDRVDAMTQALIYLHRNQNYLRAAMEKVREYLGRVDI